MEQHLQFASDNYCGMCPEALDYLLRANAGCDYPYGDDTWTARAADRFRELFETGCEVFFVFNGTAANAFALASLCQSYHSVICHELAHIETDECGAPEFASNGSKLLLAGGAHGRLDAAEVQRLVTRRRDIHYPKPKVLSLTQATEVGTLYPPEALAGLRELAGRHRLKIHMDGARFANAVAAMNVTPAELTWKAGVDVLVFSGTKNGLAYGEAILFFDKTLAEDFAYRCKQGGQLAPKMRFIAAPWLGLLETGAWLRNAQHANACAAELSARLTTIEGVELMEPTEANGVFVRLSEPVLAALRARGWHCYSFIGTGGARLMCSWATTREDIDRIVMDLQEVMRQHGACPSVE